MTAFISYNSEDKPFAEQLATLLVADGHQIWIDKWELNVGDSLLEKIPAALASASAIIAVLSPRSVASNWCRKEVNAGLAMELEQSGSLLLPCIIEDCEVPTFLRDKIYADFRTEPDQAFRQLSDALRRYSTRNQKRFSDDEYHCDFAFAWGTYRENLRVAEWTFIQHSVQQEFSVLTEIRAFCDKPASELWQQREESGMEALFLASLLMLVRDNYGNRCFVLDDGMPQQATLVFKDQTGFKIETSVQSRRLGVDTGKSTLVRISNLVDLALNHFKEICRAAG